ncbi:hypothetical protein RQP46_004877 [Phenoliferia psychrophenolica]
MSSDQPPSKRPRSDASGDATNAPVSYTVVARGVSFTLSRDQCEFDSPNFFTSAFFTGFAESESRTVYTDRSPTLFSLFVDYLSGYDILPLAPVSGMTPEVALRNLHKDADYFGLTRLEAKLLDLITPPPPAVDVETASLAAWGFGAKVTLEDLMSGAVQLERDTSKHEEGTRFIPRRGETLPPLVFMRNVFVE